MHSAIGGCVVGCLHLKSSSYIFVVSFVFPDAFEFWVDCNVGHEEGTSPWAVMTIMKARDLLGKSSSQSLGCRSVIN
jgi:hypothetical protein